MRFNRRLSLEDPRKRRTIARVSYIGRDASAPITYDYLITNDAEWDTVMALPAATRAGKRAGIVGSNFTNRTMAAAVFASPFTISSVDASSSIPNLTLSGSTTNLVLDGLNIQHTSWPRSTSGMITFSSGAYTDVKIRNCRFRHGYGVGRANLDGTTIYPEYTRVNNVTNATTTSTRIALNFQDPASTDAWVEFFNRGSANVWYRIGNSSVVATTSDTLAVPGTASARSASFNPQTDTHIAVISATGTQEVNARTEIGLNRYLNSAFNSFGGVSFNNLEITNCIFEDISNAIKSLGGVVGTTIIRGNLIRRIYQDCIFLGGHVPSPTNWLYVLDNMFEIPYARSGIAEALNGDARDPHGDLFQIGGSSPFRTGNVIFAGNRCLPTVRRSDETQGVFISDTDELYRDIYIVGNLLTPGSLRGVAIGESGSDAGYLYVYGNTYVAVGGSGEGSAATFLNQQAGFNTYFARNIFGAGSAALNGSTFQENNTDFPYASPTSVFPNWADRTTATNVDQLETALTPTGVHAGRGAAGQRGVLLNTSATNPVDFVNWNNMPPGILWPDQIEQAASSTVTTGLRKILGGPNGMTVIPDATVEWQTTSDEAGTSVVQAWTTASGTANRGQWMQLRTALPSGAAQTKRLGVTIHGTYYGPSYITASTPFTLIDNQVTGWSRFNNAGLSTTADIAKILIAFRYKPDVVTSGHTLIADDPATRLRLWMATATNLRLILGSSTIATLRPSLTITTAAKTHIISMDFTQPTGTGCFWATIEDGVQLDNSPGSSGVFDTTGGTRLLPEVGSNSLFGTAGANIGFFAEGDGAAIADGAFGFFYMNYGDSNFNLPDIREPAVRARFTSDLIGSDGSGPTSSQPKIYFQGDAAGWNAGLVNKGTLSLTLAKQAGTYV